MAAYLIICPLLFLAGLVDSIAGGGGMISLPAYLLAGIPPHMALGTNKMSSAMGTSASTFRFAKKGYIKGKIALFASLAALAGSYLGANLTLLVSEIVIRRMMLVVLPIVAFYVFKNKNMERVTPDHEISEKKVFIISVGAAFFIGAYDGFYGPGTGTFLMLILTGAAGMTVQKASGLTKTINLSSNVAALITFFLHGKVLVPIGLAAGFFCILGNYVGSGLVVKGGQKVVRPVIQIVLVLLFIKVMLG